LFEESNPAWVAWVPKYHLTKRQPLFDTQIIAWQQNKGGL
jgi:hypothetical protein